MPRNAPCHPVLNRYCDDHRGFEDAAATKHLPGGFFSSLGIIPSSRQACRGTSRGLRVSATSSSMSIPPSSMSIPPSILIAFSGLSRKTYRYWRSSGNTWQFLSGKQKSNRVMYFFGPLTFGEGVRTKCHCWLSPPHGDSLAIPEGHPRHRYIAKISS